MLRIAILSAAISVFLGCGHAIARAADPVPLTDQDRADIRKLTERSIELFEAKKYLECWKECICPESRKLSEKERLTEKMIEDEFRKHAENVVRYLKAALLVGPEALGSDFNGKQRAIYRLKDAPKPFNEIFLRKTDDKWYFQ